MLLCYTMIKHRWQNQLLDGCTFLIHHIFVLILAIMLHICQASVANLYDWILWWTCIVEIYCLLVLELLYCKTLMIEFYDDLYSHLVVQLITKILQIFMMTCIIEIYDGLDCINLLLTCIERIILFNLYDWILWSTWLH